MVNVDDVLLGTCKNSPCEGPKRRRGRFAKMESYLQRALKKCIGKCVPESTRKELGIPESNRRRIEAVPVSTPQPSKAVSSSSTADFGCQCQLPWVTNAVSMDHMAYFRDVRAHDAQLSLGPLGTWLAGGPTGPVVMCDVAVQVQLPAVWAPCGELQNDRRRVKVERVYGLPEVAHKYNMWDVDLKPHYLTVIANKGEWREVPAAHPAAMLPPTNHQRLDRLLLALPKCQPNTIELSEYSALGDTGALRLCAALFGHPTLRELRLAKTGLGAAGTSLVAEVIAVHLRLTLVDLSYNAVRDVGAGSLADALKASRALQTLLLQSCEIGNPGGVMLASALMHRAALGSLTNLDLAFNPIGVAAAEALREAASRSNSLQRLSLAGTPLDPSLLAAVATALTPAGKARPSATRIFEHGTAYQTDFVYKSMLREHGQVLTPMPTLAEAMPNAFLDMYGTPDVRRARPPPAADTPAVALLSPF